jgi:NADH-quinone oxidoreductase subunit L
MLITVICICLFIGAMGKSAQFPLHVWLPDSMEGPTPISALIHAATMVTAGIFMVARMSPLFELSDTALSFILVIGSITALFMGFLGIIQNDIKRVVAYSTLSQLGYMTVALGASAYSVAVFHLMTHAFFKALLFLGAGSVIIGMHHNQDIRWMGGVRKYMPITWITSLLGSLALIGTPLFSGFYSKDSDHRGRARKPPAGRRLRLLRRARGRVRDRLLLVPHVLPGVPRQGALRPEPGRAPRAPRARRCPCTTTADHATPHESPWVVTGAAGAAGDPVGGDRLLDDRADAVRRLLQGRDLLQPREAPGDGARWPKEFHGPLAMALHGLTTMPFWLALAGVVLLVHVHGQPGAAGGDQARAARSTRCWTTSTTSTGSTRTSWPAARACTRHRACGRAATRP